MGDTDAMYLVGVHYLDATQQQQQQQQGIQFIEQAAAAGHGGALYYLALLVRRHTYITLYIVCVCFVCLLASLFR